MKVESQYIQPLADCRDTQIVGGKAVNLGKMIRAGFPVPGGFAITTAAYKLANTTVGRMDIPAALREEILTAYRDMGAGVVAVRSSATAEDMGNASMAGQYETFLDIEGEAQLLECIKQCWASIDAPRTRAYLAEHGINISDVAMAVVVQRLIPADASGVLFTSNPNPGNAREMLLEASWGLGEMVVSGKVQPDVLRIDQTTGRVIHAKIADKQIYLAPGVREERPVEESRRRIASVSGTDVYSLWQLGRRAAEHFGRPQDIEWAIHGGAVYLIQSRPITTAQGAEACHDALLKARRHLREELRIGHGPWVIHNLAETLPHPTPLTWSVIRDFMSGAGGFGTMYRQAGFEPAKSVEKDGFLENIMGRIYMDAARAPEMFFEEFPFAYNLEELKKSPDASQLPPTVAKGSLKARYAVSKKLGNVTEKLRALSQTLDHELRDNLFAEVTGYVERTKPIDLKSLSIDWLYEQWDQHERMVLGTFAPQLLLPSLISGMAMGELRAFLQECFWNEDPDALAQLCSSGGAADRTLLANQELYEVAKGTRSLQAWITDHGHRAAGEFDLSVPRWREQPELVKDLADRLGAGNEAPIERHRRNGQEVQQKVAALRSRLAPADQSELDQRIEMVRRYMIFREDGKDVLMLGYDLLRDLALEAGRRLEIGDDVFHLTREEMFDALRVGFAPYHVIQQRKASHRAEEQLALPRVIDADAVDELGESSGSHEPLVGGQQAFAVSAGAAHGPARILRSPNECGDIGKGYILVCPSTDPSWTPLFVNAAGLVLECGGTLSHGAVVAREMGLPAVVLPDATRIFSEGETLHVDGRRGWVGRAQDVESHESADESTPVTDTTDTFVANELIPPPPGRKDRRATRLRNGFALFWTVFLILFFTLPKGWLHDPSLRLIDFFLWPFIRFTGKPVTVVFVAASIATVTLLLQRTLTDNKRLLEAKRRASMLKKQAEQLPSDSPRRAMLLKLAAPVQFRALLAAMVPVGILLGPMVMPFVWLQQRVDPAAWNAPSGSAVRIVASVDSDWPGPVTIDVPSNVKLDDTTPRSRTLPPLRATLQRLLALYRQPQTSASDPWEIQLAPDLRQRTADDLQAYLDAGIPPQPISWLLHAPQDFSGRFPITVTTEGKPPVTMHVVLGDGSPPSRIVRTGAAGNPVKELRIAYAKSSAEPIFFRPLAKLASADSSPILSKLAAIDIGWLWLYILVYLPVLMILRALLRVA